MSKKDHQIANQIMRGFNFKRPLDNQDQRMFRAKYHPLITWITENLPKSMNAAVGGAVGKCFLWHEDNRIEVLKFLKKLKNTEFNGATDPAHVFWLFWSRNINQIKSEQFYKKTISAIRYHIKGNECTNLVAPRTDVFEWDLDYKVMIYKIINQNVDSYRVKIAPSTEEVRKILDFFENGPPKVRFMPPGIQFAY